MSRFRILLGLAVVVGLSIPAAANASTSVSGPSRAAAAPQAVARPVTRAECSAVRHYMHRPHAECAQIVSIYIPATGTAGSIHAAAAARRLMTLAARPSAGNARSYYWMGWELYCEDELCTYGWGTEQDFTDTFEPGVGVWNNTHSCGNRSLVTWCGLWHNGWSNWMEEGENFSQGYMRAKIDTYGNVTPIGGASTVGYLRICFGEIGVC